MDFHGMNRKNLQILCKKHGIPANLKNIEMANRLASLFQKEDEETVTETKISPEEDSVEADDDDGIKEEEANLVASTRKAKKVRFSPETDNQVFEFTRSVKQNVRTSRRRQDGAAKALQQDGNIELRRSKRSVSKGITVDGSDGDVSNSVSGVAEAEKGPSNVTRRSKRIGSVGSAQEDGLIALEQFGDKGIQDGRRSTRLAAKTGKSSEEGGTSKLGTLLPAAKRSKRVVDVANKEDERETGEHHKKDDDSKVEMVRRRRSMRFVNEQTNAQDQRRSVRLKASVENTSMGQAVSKLKNDTVKAARVVKGSRVDKKTDESLVKSSKRVTRNMKRDRSAEPGVDSGTASNLSNLTPKQNLDEFAHFEQQEACGADVKAGGSSKKSKTMNQECMKDSPSSSQAKVAESVVIIEKVLDHTLDKSDDSSQRLNIREMMNCEGMEGECEDKLARDTVSILVMEEDKEEVASRSLSSPKDKLHVPTGHIIVKDIASTVMAEESTKTKDETLIYAPETELKEHSSIAKLANVEEIQENSTERWKEIHSGEDDEKGSFEKDVQADNLHGNVSECNTENSSAEEEMEITKIGVMSVAHCVNLTPEKLLGEYAQLESEEAERHNVEAISSSQKMKKIVVQEFVNDKPQGMAEDSPSTSETKATEPVVVSENVMDSPQKVSGETSAVRNSQELDSELLEENPEEKHEQHTPLLAATKKDKGEASSLSEVKTCTDNRNTSCSLSVEITLSPAAVQLAMRNPETDLGLPTGDDVVSAVITEEDKITKEETLIFTPASDLKEHSSVEAILGNSAECCKKDEKVSLEKEVQAENLHVNFSECNTENSSAEEEMEISKDSCMSVNLTPEKILDTYTQLVSEEAGEPNVEIRSSSKKMKTVSSECLKENPQGMADDSPSTSVSKTTETIMMSENVLDSTSRVSVGYSLVRNTQELNSELMNEEREEKQEQDIVQSAKRHGNFSEYNAENSSAEEQADICKVGRISDGHRVDRETLDEVKDESLMKSVQTISSERACKPNALELSGSFSTEFASHSYKEENLSECLEEDEMKALSQPIPIKKAASNVHDRSSLFTTPERNLMLMEQFSESGKICAAHIVTQHNDEAAESHDVVFTTPEKVLLLGDSGLDEVGKEEEHTTTDSPDDLNTAQNEALNEEERIVVKLHDEPNIAASPLRQSSVGNFKEDRTERNEEKGTVELHCESDTCTGPDKHTALANFVSDGAENSGGNKALEFYEESVVFTGLEGGDELFGYSGQEKDREGEGKKAAQIYEEAGLSTELADPECEVGWLGMNNADESGRLEGQFLYGDSEQKKPEKAAAEFHDESVVPSIPERHPFPEESELEEAAKSEENKALELQADCDNFTAAIINAKSHDMSDVLIASESHTLLKESELEEAARSEENKAVELQVDCDNFTGVRITAKTHDMSDVLTASDSHSLMEDFEPDEEGSKDVELLGESNISTDVERHLLSEELAETRMIKHNTTATCEESFVFISPERRRQLGNSEPHTAGKQERKEVEFKDEFTRLETRLLLGESGHDRLDNGKSGSAQYQSHHASSPKVILKDDNVVREGHVGSPDFRENTIVDLSGSIASKVSYSHEISAEEETAGAEFVGLDAMQGTSEQSRGNSPHVDSVNHFDFDTIMDAEINVSFSSYVLALPAEGNSETSGEISNHIEVAGTCSVVSEESGPSTDIPNQIHDAVGELAIIDELIDAKLTKNTQSDSKTNSLPAEGDSETIGEFSSHLEEKSSPSMDFQNHINDALEEKLAVTDNSKADELIEAKVTKNVDSSGGSDDVSGKTNVLAGREDEHLCYNSEVTNPVDTAFEKNISMTPDKSTLQKNMKEEAGDDEIPKGEATRSLEETLNESSENIGESGTTSSEKQVRREQVLIYRTQAKPKRHDMKENAPNSKIVDALNVTAPRTSKRQPLQDLRNN